jgi:RimJ/RimL family protein N-acetyltransferase
VAPFTDPDPPLRDDRIALRLASERDIPEILIAHQDDPTMYMRLGAERPPTGAELGRYSEQADAERAVGSHVALTIVEPGFDDCRGQINAHHVDWEAGRAELGIWLAPQVRSRGYARDALKLAGRWLLGPCGLERLTVLTETDNEPMIRAAQAAGFVREGVFRGHSRERGERDDAVVLSLIPGDLG